AEFQIALPSPDEAKRFDQHLKRGAPPDGSDDGLNYKLFTSDDPEANVRNEEVHLGVRALATRNGDEWEILVRADSALGKKAYALVHTRLLTANLRILLGERGALPITLKVTELEVPESKKISVLATLVPLILVLMTITGAVYPSIDLTAGERE